MIYQNDVLILLDIVLTKARILREQFSKWEDDANLEELLFHFDKFKIDYQKLKEAIPEDFATESQLSRHYSWLERYLGEQKPQRCSSDIDNICEKDIEKFREDYIQYLMRKGIDQELKDKIFPLLQSDNCDSAVRKSFVVLTERLRKSFGQPGNVDGRELVNKVFGRGGILNNKIENEERESLRNLFDGMYGIFRNEFMHNDIEIDIVEAEGIISMINVLLKKIEKIKTKI